MDVNLEIRDEEPVTTSLEIARVFEKRHNNVLRDIEEILKTPEIQE